MKGEKEGEPIAGEKQQRNRQKADQAEELANNEWNSRSA